MNSLITKLTSTLLKHNCKITTAESCTGGGVAYYLTSLPGSSAWFDRGFVTYSNLAKEELLGVQPGTLLAFGAVSEAVAREMAEGALARSQAQISIAITGIAGPDGGSKDKPVGTIWFAWAGINQETQACVYQLNGDRQAIREQAIKIALEKLREFSVYF